MPSPWWRRLTSWRDVRREPARTTSPGGVPAALPGLRRSLPAHRGRALRRRRLGRAGVPRREVYRRQPAKGLNNVLGQALLARRMGRDPSDRGDRRRHTASPRNRRRAVRHGLHGVHRRGRPAPGAERRAHAPAGAGGGGDEWLAHPQGRHQRGPAGAGLVDTAHYLLGTAAGPHPLPAMVRLLPPQSVRRRADPGAGGRLPDAVTVRGRRLRRDRRLRASFLDDAPGGAVSATSRGDGMCRRPHTPRPSPWAARGVLRAGRGWLRS
ncbi:hypothetical protein QJS66_02140 [Kocuria rhizophila]|nr:hypothetical protein QJS66_02140 [Kocuria rhizophila]